MTAQPEALRLADALLMGDAMIPSIDLPEAADELRRLHEVNTELLAALETMRYAYASHGNHAYCQVGTEEDVLNLVDAAIAKAERTTP